MNRNDTTTLGDFLRDHQSRIGCVAEDMNVLGFRVVTNNLLPDRVNRIELRQLKWLDPEFVKEYNEWLRDTFGTTPFIIMAHGVVICSQATSRDIRRVIHERVERLGRNHHDGGENLLANLRGYF